jgi:hypothetical protein
MNVSELIVELEAFRREHGDVEVETLDLSCNRVAVRRPRVAWRRLLVGRETKPRFWHPVHGLEVRGEKVCGLL